MNPPRTPPHTSRMARTILTAVMEFALEREFCVAICPHALSWLEQMSVGGLTTDASRKKSRHKPEPGRRNLAFLNLNNEEKT